MYTTPYNILMTSKSTIQMTTFNMKNLHANFGGVNLNLNLLHLPLSTLITTRSQHFYLFHVHFTNFLKSVHSMRFQGGCERNQGRKSSCHRPPHLRYSIFTSPTGFTKAIPHCSKVLSYILYDGLVTRHGIGQEFSLEGKGETNAMLSIYHGRQG